MKKLIWAVFLFGLLGFFACGDEHHENGHTHSSKISKPISDLDGLLESNPNLASATLKQIKDAASGSQTYTLENSNTHNMPVDINFINLEDVSHISNTSTKPVTQQIDQKVAQEAQELIEEVIENFDLYAQINAGIKFMGLTFKTQEKLISKMDMSNEKMAGIEHKTCEEVVSETQNELNNSKFETKLEEAKKLLKTALSGCDSLKAKVFVDCMNDINMFTNFTNEHATCDLDGIESLVEMFEQESGQKFDDFSNKQARCMEKDFSECGFEAPETDETDN